MPFRLTTVATFRTPTAAWVARNYLLDLGIRAFVIDDNIATAIWTWGNAIGWTKLQVESEFEQAAQQALLLRHEARDLLLVACKDRQLSTDKGRPSPPSCMDRKPVTAEERPQRKMNQKEDMVGRAKLAAVFAIVLLGCPLGLPGRWEQLVPLYSLLGALGLMGFSTRLLLSASKSQDPMRPGSQSDLYWGRFMNALAYSLLTVAIIYFATFRY